MSQVESPFLDQEKQNKARTYARARRRLTLLETGLSLAALLALIFSGGSTRFTGLFDWAAPAVAVVYFLVFVCGFELLTAPLSYYGGFVLPHRYGLSTQKVAGWLADGAKGSAISLALGSAAVALAYWLLQQLPDWWWLLAWGFMLIITTVLSILGPVILVPIFYKMKPLAEGELKARLEQLAKKAGAVIRGVFTLDFSSRTTAANAALMGLGRTRRIVLSDTLIQQYPLPEIEVITAHEIGHHLHRDVLRLFVIQSALYLVGLKIVDLAFKAGLSPLGFKSPSDPGSLPFLFVLIGAIGFFIAPLLNGYTRRVESEADYYALQLTGSPATFIAAMTRLANQNLAGANPPAWEEVIFYDHPSYDRRVAMAGRFEKQQGGPGNIQIT